MQLNLDESNGLVIQSFIAGELRINNKALSHHVILTADEIICEWSPPAIEDLSIADFRLLLDRDPEVILFGTGTVQQFPDGALTTEILRRGVGFEVMNTSAACRTFNVLVSEHRRVVAALMIR